MSTYFVLETFLVAQNRSVSEVNPCPQGTYILVSGDRESNHKSEKWMVCHMVRSAVEKDQEKKKSGESEVVCF